MPRRPTPIGQHGRISVTQLGRKRWYVDGRVRDRDGKTQRLRRTYEDVSKTAAEEAWRTEATELAGQSHTSGMTLDTRANKLLDRYIEEIEEDARLKQKTSGTVRTFKSHVKNWVRPSLGSLTIREWKVLRLETLVLKALDLRGYDTAAGVRAVLSGVCGLAVRMELMDTNPVRSMKRLKAKEKKEVVALDRVQRAHLKGKLTIFAERKQVDALGRSRGKRAKVWLDLPDLQDAMLSTGIRLGELTALRGTSFDPATNTVRVDGHIVREPGVGLIREDYRKADGAILVLAVPDWSVPMWRRRSLAAGDGPMFPGFRGGWQDPVNLIHRLREAFDACGFDWVTSHVWRKTVAAVLDEAGLPLGVVADQLGNTQRVAERHYRPTRSANAEAASALEAVY